ncbi:Zinc/iron permease [Choiromyces venosus 120613-1]|uniref:Zinc/iron permease n=1 Tax=Choiromyces venosus 120613-1 TaxID=1336337 RepID=A0A3N4K6Q5_9PEZI|nr:Zinc/iron permease [Choiromyces venosus 120613-1]
MNCPTRDPEPTGNPFFNQNPPALDKTLTTRSSLVCGGSLSDDEYNLGLHIMGLFLVLAQSSFACAFPLIAKKFPRLRIPPSFLFGARHFGTGVLIATAFVHLLPTAFNSLTNECLPKFWNQTYPAMAGAIAMAAVFFITIIEMVFTKGLCKDNYSDKDQRDAKLETGNSYCNNRDADEEDGGADKTGEKRWDEERLGTAGSEEIGGEGGVGRMGFGMAGKRRSRSHSVGQQLQKYEEMEKKERQGQRPDRAIVNAFKTLPGIAHLTPEQVHKKALLQCALLEMGILFHSVFIGMALSVTGGSRFVVLLIAIIFHQSFEGLALGSRIAVLKWKVGAIQPWAMAVAYGLTTPIGQAIGLATHSLYSPASQTGLLMVGMMNAISSGLLVFASLVELLAEDFLSDESWRVLTGKKRIFACIYVVAGAFGMAFVGAFA